MTWTVIPGTSSGSGPRGSESHASSKDSRSSSPKLTLLVVDDEPSICKVLSMWFSPFYNVVAVQSGEAALAILRNDHVDLLLLDLRIPDMRGDVIFEVAVAYQSHLSSQTLFYTGDITPRAEELIKACHCEYIEKPFDLEVLEQRLAKLSPRVQDAAG